LSASPPRCLLTTAISTSTAAPSDTASLWRSAPDVERRVAHGDVFSLYRVMSVSSFFKNGTPSVSHFGAGAPFR